MDFEFIFIRQNGERLQIVGRFTWIDACDCGDHGHNHIDDISIDAITDDFGETVALEPYEVALVEAEAVEEAYNQLECA